MSAVVVDHVTLANVIVLMVSKASTAVKVFVQFYVPPTDNTEEVFAIVKMVGKEQNAMYRNMIVEYLIAPVEDVVLKVNVFASQGGEEKDAKKLIA